MKGKILDYSVQESKGIISGDDGKRYSFTNSEWKGAESPKINQTVDFEIDGENAKGIYLIKSSMNFDGVADKLADLNTNEKVKGFSNYISVISKNGIQNKFGFLNSILLAIFMFIPILESKPLFGSGFIQITLENLSSRILTDDISTYIFIGLFISTVLFYIGAKQIFTKISVSIVAILLILNLKDLFVAFYDFDVSKYNTYFALWILIVLILIYPISAFKKSYKEAS